MSVIDYLVNNNAIVHPKMCFWDDFLDFMEAEKSNLLDATYHNKTDYFPAIVLLIAGQSPDLKENMKFRAKTPFDTAANLVEGLSGKRNAAPKHASRIFFWLMSLHAEHPSTLSIERKVFGGKSFEQFFGFHLPQEGEQARALYNQWKSQNLIKDGSLHMNEGTERTVRLAENSETQSYASAINGTSKFLFHQSDKTQTSLVPKAFLGKWCIAGVAIAVVTLTALFVTSRTYGNAIKRTLLPTISLSTATFQIDSFYLDGQQPTRSNRFTNFNPAHAEGVLLLGAPDATARDLLSSTQDAGFHGFELISEYVRTASNTEWPFESLAGENEVAYGRSLGAAAASDRFQAARHLQTLKLDCFSGSFFSTQLSQYSVSQGDCQRLEIEYRSFRDFEFGFIDFSPVLNHTFGYDLPDIETVEIEVDEVRSGILSALSVSSGNSRDFALIAKNYWGANTGWGTLFAGRSASAFEIGTEDTGLSVLVHALDASSGGSLFMLLDHATGAIRTRLKTTEPVQFFNIEYGPGRSDAQLTIATGRYIFEIGMQLYRDGITF